MRLAITTITAIVLTVAGNAAARDCRRETITFPDGRTIYCQTCCTVTGRCTTYCQ
jgi:hypothetical protein